MEYKKFCEEVMRRIRKCLPQECNVKEISFYETIKNNGVKKIGLTFKGNEGEAQPTIYLEEFYTEFQRGITIEEICQWLVELYREAMEARPDKEKCDFPYSNICQKICMRLVNYDLNKKFLENGVPHKKVEDLAIYYTIYLHTGKQGMASVVIRDEMIQSWGISLEEVHEKAKENTLRILQPKLSSVADMILADGNNLLDSGCEIKPQDVLYTLFSETGNYGATLILFPELMQKIKEKIGEYYILPSSTQEVILVVKNSSNPVVLGKIIREVNETQVNREDWLSYHAYEMEETPEGFRLKIVEESREDWCGDV